MAQKMQVRASLWDYSYKKAEVGPTPEPTWCLSYLVKWLPACADIRLRGALCARRPVERLCCPLRGAAAPKFIAATVEGNKCPPACTAVVPRGRGSLASTLECLPQIHDWSDMQNSLRAARGQRAAAVRLAPEVIVWVKVCQRRVVPAPAWRLCAAYDAFGLIGTTFRQLDWKMLIFFERASR